MSKELALQCLFWQFNLKRLLKRNEIVTRRILVVASHADSLVNFRGPLLREMVRRGYDVHAAAPDLSTEVQETLEAIGVRCHKTPLQRTGLNPLRDLAYMRRLYKVIREFGPDVVLTYTIKPNIWGSFAASMAGRPSVAMVTGLGFSFTESGEWSGLKALVSKLARSLYRAATRRNQAVIFQNPDDLQDFIEQGCLEEPSKAHIVNGSGVDLVHYGASEVPVQPRFLMVARLLKNKGVREYGAAVGRLASRFPDTEFVLLGGFDEGPDGIAKEELDEWQRSGMTYVGQQQDVRPYIDAAAVFVLPSYREGTPRSVLEAMAKGRAIVTTDAPGCRETVQDGVNGFLVPVRDVAALEEAMARLIEAPELRVAMGRESLQIARKKYDVLVVNRMVLDILSDVIGA